MKHAGATTLTVLEPLLAQLRDIAALQERTPGAFYRKSTAWLHFHQDPAGIFADIKLDGQRFSRLPVNTREEQASLLALLRRQGL